MPLICLSAILTALILGWVLHFAQYGIDFSDESHYLIWIANPFYYKTSVTQFGFIYHPLHELLGGNIAALRQSNILITFCGAWVLSSLFLKDVFCTQSLQPVPRLAISAAFAITVLSSLVFGGLWLPTPNYNSLALQGLLVCAIGLLLADKVRTFPSIAGCFLIGVGGWLTFMAKPTTAAALFIGVGLYLFLSGRLNFRLIAVSLGTALSLLILSAFFIDGSIAAFIERLKGGLALHAIGSSHSLYQSLKQHGFRLGLGAILALVAYSAIIFLGIWHSDTTRKLHANVRHASLAILFLTIFSVLLGFLQQPFQGGKWQGFLLLTVPAATLLLAISAYGLRGIQRTAHPRKALALLFMTFPYVFTFGTENNYWILINCAGIFFVLAALLLLHPIQSSKPLTAILLSLCISAQLVTAAVVHSGMKTPYRQPQPLWLNDSTVEIGRTGNTLILSQSFAQYIKDAVQASNQAGFQKGTPVIDLTGKAPGILHAIGADSIGRPWLLGSFPGGNEYATAALREYSCQELASAWILHEPEGPDTISPEILRSFGADMATDFEIVGSIKTVPGASSYETVRTQQFMKPTRSLDSATSACILSREN